MKKKILAAFVGTAVSSVTFAGGLLTNTNQNVAFLRNPARDAAIGIDGVYSNPAGVVFLPEGFHVSLNFQSAYQTREVTSTFAPFAYGVGNGGESVKLFKGDAKAPVVPSLQAAYNRGRWSYSFNFAIGGGGGKCAFEDGLGSFESQAALLPLLGSAMGINSYSMDSYMRGRQYYYGFQVGAGMMVGSPYQTTEHLLADLRFLQQLQPDMIGIGPFIHHKDTPFAHCPDGSVTLTLRLLAILRLLFPYVLLPATTALGTLAENGREQGLQAGANVVMPNLSPPDAREKYMLYQNKLHTGAESVEQLDRLKQAVQAAGYRVVTDVGHVKREAKRPE